MTALIAERYGRIRGGRVGLNGIPESPWRCGEVQQRGDDYVGQTVNIASRVTDLATPGKLLVSEPVHGLGDGALS
ncbi:MAG: hypothetical protein AAGF73_07230 [Actinomycetota bacterium]